MSAAWNFTPPPTVVTPENRDRELSGAPLAFALICRIVEKIRHGALVFVLPDGRAIKFVGKEGTDATGVVLIRNFAFARRALLGGDIGFFESFAAGDWETPDLAACLYVFARNADHVQEAFSKSPVVAFINDLRRSLEKNTRRGARRNVAAHYDLGNRFYERWLDATMTYSSAVFPSDDAALETAQTNKYRRLAEAIDLKPGERVLEIGAGWGGFAEFAAKEVGAKVTAITISPSQLDYAARRIQREGLGERVELRLQDYRDVDGRYDKVASIEMFEAVGEKYWPAYFAAVRDRLKPGGIAGLQIITIADRFFDGYRRSTDFIQRYVFPGGMLPSEAALNREIERAGLVLAQARAYGMDYARTLAEWSRRFLAAWDEIESMGFDARFKKLWRFYLGYCEAGFRAGTTDVFQIAAKRA